ncbi:MAG: FAD-dependent oxidoreductase [Thermoleophilia bacterium]
MSAATSRYDAIVVGGGPAGLAAAYTLAKGGASVVCLERGDWSGSKNMMGGLIYSQPTGSVFPEFWREAPLERHVTRRDMWLATGDSAIKLSFETADFAVEPYNSFTVYRSSFDKWLSRQTAAAGALMIRETLVEDLLWDGGRIAGVRTGRPQGDLEADVVIIAEGVNTFLTEKAGLSPCPPRAANVALAVKEVLALPKERIEDRFDLDPGAGAAIEIIGETTGGLPGTGFIYTNRDTISVGVGVLLDSLVDNRAEAYNLLERFKQQSQVRRLIQGAAPREYSAHLIPEGGYSCMPRLYGDGVLVAGDAAGMVNAINSEGANLALLSGKMAAETALACRKRGDFSAAALGRYRLLLEDTVILKDLRKYDNATKFLSTHHHLFGLYPELMAALAREFLTVDQLSKAEKERLLLKLFRSQVPTRRLLKDFYQAWRALT